MLCHTPMAFVAFGRAVLSIMVLHFRAKRENEAQKMM
jgi:hypothetical protein